MFFPKILNYLIGIYLIIIGIMSIIAYLNKWRQEQPEQRRNVKKVFGLLAVCTLIFLFGSCSLINTSSTTTSGLSSTGYPDSVVYKISLANGTYLCSSFNVSNTDTGISLQLNDVYSMSSDGKITWIGQAKTISAVTIEKISK
jgi:hypothetical protein